MRKKNKFIKRKGEDGKDGKETERQLDFTLTCPFCPNIVVGGDVGGRR